MNLSSSPSSSHFARLQLFFQRFELNMLWRVPAWVSLLGQRGSPIGLPIWLASVAIWILRRSYDGIRHDGMFYAGQTMVRLGDPNVAADLFFRYGSQDQYTIYSSVMAFAVREFGWVAASMGSVIVFQTAFVAATTMLLLEFAPLALVGLGIALCGVFPFYGPYNIFSLGEPFTTARLLAEPFLIFAIVAMFKNRYLLCMLLMALATAMHPLLAAPVWFVLFCMVWIEIPARRRLLTGVLVAGLAVFAVAAYLKPLFFFATFDDLWWSAFVAHTSQVSLQGWDYHGWELIAFDLGVPLLLARQLKGRNALFLQLLALALTLGLLITAWGAGWMRSVFLTEIQIWRAGELAHLMAAGLFPFLIWKLRGNGITVLLGMLFILLGFDYSNYDSAAVGVALGIVLLALGRVVPVPTTSMKLMVAAFVFAAFGIGLYNQLDLVGYTVANDAHATLPLTIRGFSSTWLVGAAVIFGVAILAFRMPRAAVVLGCVLVICVAAMWDYRTPFQKYMENQIGQASPLGDYIPPGATVFWSDDLRLPWFILDRPSFYSRNQAAGLVFKRETAMAFLRNETLSAPIKSSSEICEQLDRLRAGSTCALNSDAVRDVCAPGSTDFVILSREVDDMLPNRTFTVKVEGWAPFKYDVYNCRALIEHKSEPRRRPKFPSQASQAGAVGSAASSSATRDSNSAGAGPAAAKKVASS